MVEPQLPKAEQQEYTKKILSAFRALTIGVGASGFVALLVDQDRTFAAIVFLMFLSVGLARGWMVVLLGFLGVPLLAFCSLVTGAPATALALAGSFAVFVAFSGIASWKHRPRPTE